MLVSGMFVARKMSFDAQKFQKLVIRPPQARANDRGYVGWSRPENTSTVVG